MKIPHNTIQLNLAIDQDTDVLDISVEYNLSVTMGDAQQIFYKNIISGLMSKLNTELEAFAFQGSLLHELSTLRSILDDEEEDEFGIEFEAAEELLEAVKKNKDEKIVEFNGKKKPHWWLSGGRYRLWQQGNLPLIQWTSHHIIIAPQ